MSKLKLGIIPAPGLTNIITDKIKDNLEEKLTAEFDEDIEWEIETQVDQITGAAESVKEIMNQATHLKQINAWDYVISLTDLPIFNKKYIVLADIDTKSQAAQISLPAFGFRPSAKNINHTLIHMAKELYYNQNSKVQDASGYKRKERRSQKNKQDFFPLMKKMFRFTSLERKELKDNENGSNIRFILKSVWHGRIKLLAGMTIANRPWSIMPSFKKVIGLAFATGSYMLIFNTLWQLSAIYDVPRFVLLMLAAMSAMVLWIIFAHNLWEKKRFYKSRRLRSMYNATTISTLAMSVITFYFAMFILFSIAVMIIVPDETFAEVVGHEINFLDYLKLAWLVSSAATVAGAIGAGLEDEESVRQITYGYRQYVRSKKVEERERQEKKEEEGKVSEEE